MSLLRSILRVKSINHAAKAVGRVILPGRMGKRFQRAMPLLDPFTINIPNGQEIHFEPFGDICSKFLKFEGWNAYETGSIELFYALAQHAEVTFDVGAYLGYFGLLAAAAKPGNRSYLFEAVPTIAEYAAKIAARNPHLRVQVISGAVSDHKGTLSLFLPVDPMSSDTSANPDYVANRKKVDVSAISLDDFVSDNVIDRVDLLKIDTETTEPSVLAGFAKTLARCRPTFICEVLPDANIPALEKFKQSNNYACAWVTDTGLIPKDTPKPDLEKKYLNYLFYPLNTSSPMIQEIQNRLHKA